MFINFQQPDSSIVESAVNDLAPNRLQEMVESTSFPTSQRRHFKSVNHIETLSVSCSGVSFYFSQSLIYITCTIHFITDCLIVHVHNFWQTDSSTVESAVKDYSPPKRLQDMVGTSSFPTSQRKHFKSDNPFETQAVSSSGVTF